ncbi:COG1470 family protein [Lacinutrix chionoecetis]
MITITSENYQEKIKIVEKEIILNGSPNDLKGHVQFVNKEKDKLRIKSLALIDKNKKKISNSAADFMRLSIRLNPGEQKLINLNHKLPSTTPPGTYENYIMLGKEMHKVKMIVQPTVDIDIHPSEFTFLDTSPGKKHTAVITLTNTGNLPFQIPNLKHGALLDMDLLCRAFGISFRDKGNDSLESTLDDVSKNIKANLIDWVSVSVDEFGDVVQPGNSVIIHVHFTIPKNADSKIDYDGTFRFWNKEIYVVIKSHTKPIKTRGNETAK